MKRAYLKLLGMISVSFMLCGCNSNDPEFCPRDQLETNSNEFQVHWIMKPTIEATSLDDLSSGCFKEKGYPKLDSTHAPKSLYDYNPNACAIINGDEVTIMSYDGEVLVDNLQLDSDYVKQTDDSSYVYAFKSNDEQVVLNESYEIDDSISLKESIEENYFYMVDQKIYMNDDEIEFDTFKQNISSNQSGNEYYYLPIYKNNDLNEKLGYAKLDQDGSIVFENLFKNGPIDESNDTLLNGMIVCNTKDHAEILDMNNGTDIRLFDYKSAKVFVDGYCPAQCINSHQWGIIDENDEEYTDFMFDDMSSFYDGKAFVIVEGKCGIIEFKSELDQGKTLTCPHLYESLNTNN